MRHTHKKIKQQLGMSGGTAAAKLRKMIMFHLVQKAGLNICFQCSKEIETVRELSIEHKIPFLDSEDPKTLFFNLQNIAFSHHKCNSGAARRSPLLVSFQPGHKPVNRAINENEVKSIKKELLNKGRRTMKDIANKFGVKHQLVRDINAGKSYRNIAI